MRCNRQLYDIYIVLQLQKKMKGKVEEKKKEKNFRNPSKLGRQEAKKLLSKPLRDSASTVPYDYLQLVKDFDKQKLVGNLPNVEWRAIPMDDLRKHPLYESLPNHPFDITTDIAKVNGLDHAHLFRQDTWQWNALHRGRLTTSKLSACLGFYEPIAAQRLTVPKSLQGHSRAMCTWQELCETPPRDWSFLFENHRNIARKDVRNKANIWEQAPSSSIFPYSYQPTETFAHFERGKGSYKYRDVLSARIAWGSAQEATAVLGAVNFFHAESVRLNSTTIDTENPGSSSKNVSVTVKESGMCILEHVYSMNNHHSKLDYALTVESNPLYDNIFKWINEDKDLPLIGASPDGLLISKVQK
jgi:hypothetical protein